METITISKRQFHRCFASTLDEFKYGDKYNKYMTSEERMSEFKETRTYRLLKEIQRELVMLRKSIEDAPLKD